MRRFMADNGAPWPDWSKPATKGELIEALVQVRGCVIEIHGALIGVKTEDARFAQDRISGLHDKTSRLLSLINEIGGAKDG